MKSEVDCSEKVPQRPHPRLRKGIREIIYQDLLVDLTRQTIYLQTVLQESCKKRS